MKKLVITLVVLGILTSLAAPTVLAQSPSVRLWFGANDTGPAVFEVENGRVYLGPRNAGQPILTCSEDRIYRGPNTKGEILYTISGGRLHLGPTTSAPVLFTLWDNRIFAGPNTSGDILYTIAGERVFEGGSTSGQIVLTANQNLENSDTVLKLLLPVLVRLSEFTSIRLYADLQMTQLLYEYTDGRVLNGSVGDAVLFFDGTTVFFPGPNATGEGLFTVGGDHVFVGSSANGPVAYTIRDNHVFEGMDTGPIIYTIQGDRMFTGASPAGRLVFQADRNLEISDVRFLLPILADWGWR
ncbi:MAG: hypothetical protein ACE5HA_05280 [Anaerolineae bacterium]